MKKIVGEVKKKLSLLLAVAMVIGSIPSNILTVAAAEPNTEAVLEEAAPVEEATTLVEEETTLVEETTPTEEETASVEEETAPTEETERSGIKSDSTIQSVDSAFTVTTSITDQQAVVDFIAGTTTEEDAVKTVVGENLVFTITPKTGYQVTEVKYSIENGATDSTPVEEEVDGVTNYTINSAEMTNNVTITVTTAELPVITVQDDASTISF